MLCYQLAQSLLCVCVCVGRPLHCTHRSQAGSALVLIHHSFGPANQVFSLTCSVDVMKVKSRHFSDIFLNMPNGSTSASGGRTSYDLVNQRRYYEIHLAWPVWDGQISQIIAIKQLWRETIRTCEVTFRFQGARVVNLESPRRTTIVLVVQS